MSFELRTLVVGLAAFAGTGLVVSALVPMLISRSARSAAGVRSLFLMRLRLLPVTAALLASAAATIAFLVFESRKAGETVSWSMIALAIVGGLLLGLSAWRWYQLAVTTRRTTRAWFASAQSISLEGIAVPTLAVDTNFPIVAVVGLFRPRLIIARSVLATCTADELRAVLAHEQAHLNRRDNLRRLALIATPDVLAWLPISARLFSAWYEAAEEAADDNAEQTHRDGRLHLASALVKVARIAAGTSLPPVVPAAALYTGSNLETRVRRLLAPAAEPSRAKSRSATLALVVAIAAIVFATGTPIVHEWIESAIHLLP